MRNPLSANCYHCEYGPLYSPAEKAGKRCNLEDNLSEVLRKLEAAKIANAQLNSVASLSSHPILRNVQAVWGGQKIDMAALPVQTDFNCSTEVPDLDQHGPALRAEFKVRS